MRHGLVLDAPNKRAESASVAVSAVTAFTRPYDPWYDTYQRFYHEALRRSCLKNSIAFKSVAMTRLPRMLRLAREIRRYVGHLPVSQASVFVHRLARAIEGPVHTPSSLYHNSVGQYLVDLADGTRRRVCIDAADYPALRSPELVSWSDHYFKANFWPSEEYPANVHRIVNGDPLILQRVTQLRTYRAAPKNYDICAIVRVRAGEAAVEGIEHNLRLLEALNRARCSKFILAYLMAGDVEADARRLRKVGIRSTTRSVPPADLWRQMGGAWLNVIRLGMHDCLPWRIAGALAIGTGIVLDQLPRASWPTPLREGVNFLSLDAETTGSPLAAPEQYEAIPERIETWLSDRATIRQMMTANARYFDQHVESERVGDYIIRTVSTS